MKTILAISALLLSATSFADARVALPGHGEVTLSETAKGGWTYGISRVDKGEMPDVFLVKFVADGKKEELPPAVRVEHVMEQLDVQYRWNPGAHGVPIPWSEPAGDMLSQATMLSPVFAWISQTDANRLTFSFADASRPTLFTGYERDRSGSKLHTAVTFFSRGGTPVKGHYETVIRYDFRNLPYYETVADACTWIATFPGQEPRRVPDVAYEPLWNSWYGYHIGYNDKDIEREAVIAKDLGITTIMYDMGWDRQGSTNSSSFAACGDWRPDPTDFPDLKGNIAKLHAMGLKTILWCGIPLMGKDAKNVPRFQGKYTTSKPWVAGNCYALDPRYPEVRRFIVDTLVEGLKEFDNDGWKIDFIQEFGEHGEDRVPKEGMNGRDFRWCSDAAAVLQEEFATKTREVKPDVMFEYMMLYAGAMNQRAATQVRAGDCPADAVWNRNQSVRLRLLCGNRCAVHSDMLTWSQQETPEACALQIISVLHSVIQYGMRLTELTEPQKQVVRHWIKFCRAHRETLYKGAFRPHGPGANYPLIEMESPAERIVTVHQPGMAVTAKLDKPVYIVNGASAEGILVDCDRPAKVRLVDACGITRAELKVSTGIHRLAIPLGGYAVIDPFVPALAGNLTVAARGAAPTYAVVIPAKASPVERYAAAEFVRTVARQTGVSLQIRNDDASVPTKAVFIGSTRHDGLLSEAESELASLGDDGFRLVAKPPHLFVIGSPRRGVLYGVYELLERFGGCRWYASWCEKIPTLDAFAVPDDLLDRQVPAFEMRQPFWHDVNNHRDFAARLRVNGYNHTKGPVPPEFGGDDFRFGGDLSSCHTFRFLCDPEVYFDTHPEYFSLVNGKRLKKETQLCLTNPDVLNLVTSNVLARIRKDPTARFFGVSQNDWRNWCECPTCKALDDAEGSHAGTVLTFVNALAERVEKEFPDVTIETLAYMYTRNLPKTVRPRKNVLICLCTWECDFARPLDKSQYESNVAFCRDIAEWRSCCPNLYVWDYVTDFNNYPMPFPDFDALVGNVRFFRDHGVKYLFEQGDSQGSHADFAELKAWLLAKLMWNPDQDVEPLIDDFISGFYGKGAPFVRAYFNDLRKDVRAWAEANPFQLMGIYSPVTHGVLTDGSLSRAEKLWRQAEEATHGDAVASYNVRMGAFSVDYTQLERLRARERCDAWLADMPDVEGEAARKRMLAGRLLAVLKEVRDIRLVETPGRDARLKGAWQELISKTNRVFRPEPKRSVEFGSGGFYIGDGAERVEVPDAKNGRAISIRQPKNPYDVKHRLDGVAFAPGERYALRVHARLATDVSLHVGVRGCGNGERFGVDLRAHEGGAEWLWHDVGEWVPSPGDYVSFLRAHGEGEALVDSIEIVRVGK